VLLMPNSKHLTHGISNLVSLITKTKVGLSLNELISDLVLEALLDGSLIGCTSVFEPKRHGCVVVSTEGCDERRLDLVLLS
jgi:hypothetical protein